MTTQNKYFLFIDNLSRDFYIARRECDEVIEDLRDMKPGEIRSISEDNRFEVQCCAKDRS